jgi:hypothetical protein
MRNFDVSPDFRFPYATFCSAVAFQDFQRSKRTLLDARYTYEVSLARAARENMHHSTGTCGLCLKQTRFSTRIPRDAPDAAIPAPNWREQQVCDCPQKLNNRFRAMLQLIGSEIGLLPWMRVLLIGEGASIEPHLQTQVAQMTARRRSGGLLPTPLMAAGAYHLIISSEHLHAEPSIESLLADMRAALMPGGKLFVSAPFDVAAATSRAACAGAPGVLGWDILKMLERTGFESTAAHLFWSEEFGYLGPFNLIFSASA